MTTTSWAMFIIGIAIGLIFTAVTSIMLMNEQLKSIKGYHEWLTKYASLTDEQYNNLSNYVENQLNLMIDTIGRLLDAEAKKAHDDKEVLNKIISVTNDILKSLGKNIDRQFEIMNAIDDLQTIEDSRWTMLYDYIYSDETEEEKDLCDNCANVNSNKCLDCTERISNSEVFYCNYKPIEENENNGDAVRD